MTGANGESSPEAGFALADRSEYRPDEMRESDHADELSAYEKRKQSGLWTGFTALAVALAVLAGYGYSVMSEINAQLAQQTSSFYATGQRLNGIETKLQTWKLGQDGLAAQLARTDAGWKSAVRDAEEHSDRSVAQAESGLHKQWDARSRIMEGQISQVAGDQRVDQERLTQLEEQLSRTRQELAAARQESARGAAALRVQQVENRRAIASIDSRLSPNEVGFGVQKSQAEEIAPGVSFHLTGADVRHQRFDGWIWFAPAERTIWIRAQDARQPVVFYPTQGTAAYELVVTRVDRKGVVGFLLIPQPGGGAAEETRVSDN